MSRTYRRKNGWNAPTCSFEINDDGYFVEKLYDKSSREYKLEKNKYHRDTSMFRSGIPHTFVNLERERPLRRKTKEVLNKWLKNPDFEPMVPHFRRDAGWYYF